MYKCSICSPVHVPSVIIYTTDEPDYTPPDNLYQTNQPEKVGCLVWAKNK